VNRTLKPFKAALNLAAAHDPRITNASAWKLGLANLPDAHVARHSALSDQEVRALVAMPSSLKGKGRKRIERRPVPIPMGLAARLRTAAGRGLDAPLLLQPDGTRWSPRGHVQPFARAAALAGVPDATAYALRHSSIIRALLLNVPIRIVAAQHDTSVSILETNYASYILDHSDALSRRALLDLSAGSQP
jgi:hypothetical protein